LEDFKQKFSILKDTFNEFRGLLPEPQFRMEYPTIIYAMEKSGDLLIMSRRLLSEFILLGLPKEEITGFDYYRLLFEMRTLTDELTVLNQAMDNAKNLKEEF
jgi:hypothetical protein